MTLTMRGMRGLLIAGACAGVACVGGGCGGQNGGTAAQVNSAAAGSSAARTTATHAAPAAVQATDTVAVGHDSAQKTSSRRRPLHPSSPPHRLRPSPASGRGRPPAVRPGSRQPSHRTARPPAAILADCQRLPPVAPLVAGTRTPTAKLAALQVLPRVAALEHLLEAPAGPAAAAARATRSAAAMRADLADLDTVIRRALVPGGKASGAAVARATATFTAGVQELGLPQCGMAAY